MASLSCFSISCIIFGNLIKFDLNSIIQNQILFEKLACKHSVSQFCIEIRQRFSVCLIFRNLQYSNSMIHMKNGEKYQQNKKMRSIQSKKSFSRLSHMICELIVISLILRLFLFYYFRPILYAFENDYESMKILLVVRVIHLN